MSTDQVKSSSKWCWTLYSPTVKQSLPQIPASRNSTTEMGGKQPSTGIISAMAAHCVPSICLYREGKNNARLASQKTEVGRRWDLIRNQVACRVLELHSESRAGMRFREQAGKEACAKQPIRKTWKKQSKISVTISLLRMPLVQLLCWLQSLVQWQDPRCHKGSWADCMAEEFDVKGEEDTPHKK